MRFRLAPKSMTVNHLILPLVSNFLGISRDFADSGGNKFNS